MSTPMASNSENEESMEAILHFLFRNVYTKPWRKRYFPSNQDYQFILNFIDEMIARSKMSFKIKDSRYNKNKIDRMMDNLINRRDMTLFQMFAFLYNRYPDHVSRYVGGVILVYAGLDMQAFTEEGAIFGYEIKATWSLFHYEGDVIEVHLGAGISCAAKIEDGTVDARFLGCGTKVGRRIGTTIFDNEISVDIPNFLEKIWLWKKGQEQSSTKKDSDQNEITLREIEIYVHKHRDQPSTLRRMRRRLLTQLGQSILYPFLFSIFWKGTIEVHAGLDILDMKASTVKKKIFGYEIKATLTLLHYNPGLIEVNVGVGISSAAKIENGTVDARFLGCGTKVGKRIGITIFDNELSIDIPAIFEKIWLFLKGE